MSKVKWSYVKIVDEETFYMMYIINLQLLYFSFMGNNLILIVTCHLIG